VGVAELTVGEPESGFLTRVDSPLTIRTRHRLHSPDRHAASTWIPWSFQGIQQGLVTWGEEGRRTRCHGDLFARVDTGRPVCCAAGSAGAPLASKRMCGRQR